MKRGFTLVELLVVVAVIGILASIVLVSVGGGTTRAKDTRIISDLNMIRTAAEVIRVADGNYVNVVNNSDINTLMADMTAQNATAILRTGNAAGYCVEVTLPGAKWGCVNSGLAIRTDLTSAPGCAGNNATGVPTNIYCP